MNLKEAKLKLSAIGLLVALWTFPLIRLAHTMITVLKIDSEDQSINSSNDVRWNIMVGVGYFLCILAGMIAIWILKQSKPISWFGFIPAILAAAFFCVIPFDGMIIIAPPPPAPIAAGLLCVICTGISWFMTSQTIKKKLFN